MAAEIRELLAVATAVVRPGEATAKGAQWIGVIERVAVVFGQHRRRGTSEYELGRDGEDCAATRALSSVGVGVEVGDDRRQLGLDVRQLERGTA